MSRVKLFEEIRRERGQGASIRGLADTHGVHRRTVRLVESTDVAQDQTTVATPPRWLSAEARRGRDRFRATSMPATRRCDRRTRRRSTSRPRPRPG